MRHARRLAASLSIVVVLLSGASGDARRQAAVGVADVRFAAHRIIDNRQYPPPPLLPGQLPAISAEQRILTAASQSTDPLVRRQFVVSLGQLEEPADVPTLIPYLSDDDSRVRAVTPDALAQSLINTTSEQNFAAIDLAFNALRARYSLYQDKSTAIAEGIGDLPLSEGQAAVAMKMFSDDVVRIPAISAAVAGIAAVARHRANTHVDAAVLKRLRYLAVGPIRAPDTGALLLSALEALSSLSDNDPPTIIKAATYRPPCLKGISDCGWEFRRIGVLMMNGVAPEYGFALREAAHDFSHHVRFAAVQVYGRAIPETKNCGPLIDALHDPSPHVLLQAIDLLDPRCEERDLAMSYLESWVNELSDSTFNNAWQLRTHALETFAKFAPDKAKRIANETAAAHELWQVRAAAAQVAIALKDEALAERLSKDKAPNVRTEALDALSALQSPKRLAVAVAALDSMDYQLVLTAALQLKRVALGKALADQFAATAQKPLMDALKRLTMDDKDTSRDPRVELLGRLGEYGDSNDRDFKAELATYLKDFDPVVANAAADTLQRLSGTRPDPKPTPRWPERVHPEEQAECPRPLPGTLHAARVTLSDGSTFDISLDSTDAPLTVGHFCSTVAAGYYQGLTFHRVVPDLLVQGGSPGANEYSGTSRFWHDEISGKHVAGAVVLSTRGRHTGDGQFFIELIDIPQFNHRYTVFGSTPVEEGCGPPAIMEGVTIVHIQMWPPAPPAPCK